MALEDTHTGIPVGVYYVAAIFADRETSNTRKISRSLYPFAAYAISTPEILKEDVETVKI
jgi:hypothetical protein